MLGTDPLELCSCLALGGHVTREMFQETGLKAGDVSYPQGAESRTIVPVRSWSAQ